jgi:hypothetical protein
MEIINLYQFGEIKINSKRYHFKFSAKLDERINWRGRGVCEHWPAQK